MCVCVCALKRVIVCTEDDFYIRTKTANKLYSEHRRQLLCEASYDFSLNNCRFEYKDKEN